MKDSMMKNNDRLNQSMCTIIETLSIGSVLEHVQDNDTLVIFDIDNTLVHTEQEIGSDAWAFWMVQQKLRQGMLPQRAVEYMFDIFGHVHDHIDVYPVEDKTVSVLKQLKDQSIGTVCLTGRPVNMIDRTKEQLKNSGCTLNIPDVFNCSMTVNMQHKVELGHGVICAGVNDKGSVLSTLIEKLPYQLPKKVIFVDDKKSCVESVGKACSARNTQYTGLRYGYLDKISAQFDAQKAQEQLAQLLKKHAFNKN